MADYVPTGRQLVILSHVAAHIAVRRENLITGDLCTDLSTSIDINELTTAGLLVYVPDDQVFRCTREARHWVFAHQNWRAALRPTFRGGH
jgi:hypothetical protein